MYHLQKITARSRDGMTHNESKHCILLWWLCRTILSASEYEPKQGTSRRVVSSSSARVSRYLSKDGPFAGIFCPAQRIRTAFRPSRRKLRFWIRCYLSLTSLTKRDSTHPHVSLLKKLQFRFATLFCISLELPSPSYCERVRVSNAEERKTSFGLPRRRRNLQSLWPLTTTHCQAGRPASCTAGCPCSLTTEHIWRVRSRLYQSITGNH